MYLLYQKYSNQPNDDLFIEIIHELKWMILRDLKYVNYQEREDFKQALYMKVHEVLLKKPIKENNDYIFRWSDNEEMIFKENKYLLKLLSEFGLSVNNVLSIEDQIDKKEFESVYRVFVGDVKLYQYFSKVIKTCRINFVKAYEKDPIYYAFRLNNQNNHHQEYINAIEDESQNQNYIIDISVLDDEEREFLDEYAKALNQTEFAKKLNVTQQAVSKRYNKIINKLKESI